MRQLSLEKAGAEVDSCEGCGGLWVDWFDGEVRAVATETLLARDAIAPTDIANEGGASSLRNEPIAVGACPRCARQLVSERFTVRVDELIRAKTPAIGVELLRCEDCMGAFVSRTSAEVLSSLATREAPPTPPSMEPSSTESSGDGRSPVRTDAARRERSQHEQQPLRSEGLLAVIKSFLGLR
jgi:Zn-finger nucleic acid-binding protein